MRQAAAEGRGAARPDAVEAAREAARLAVAIVAVFLSWMAASWVGGRLGLPVFFALAIDLAALIALGWTLYVLVGIWRARQREG
jgi:predicted branched-subunit amino acid permease